MTNDEVLEEFEALLWAPLVSLAVLIGEGATALDHMDATREYLSPGEMVDFIRSLSTATGVWGARRFESGDLPEEAARSFEAVVSDARQWVTDHPGELAAHDQAYAKFNHKRSEGTG